MAFENATRRKLVNLGAKTKGAEDPLTWVLPKTGVLGGLHLVIEGTVAGSLSAPNAGGMASIVKQVRLTLNSGKEIVNLSGIGYHYLVRDYIEDYKDPVGFSNARDAVTATTFDLSMYIPISMNRRDLHLGALLLQSEALQAFLEVKFEADATVATGATVTATVTPFLELFTVPQDVKDWLPFNVAHTLIEESRAIASTGDYSYSWPRGNMYLGIYHGLGIGATGADKWSQAILRLDRTDIIYTYTPSALDIEFYMTHDRAREAGQLPLDLNGTTAMGNFGSLRDAISAPLNTDLETVITVSSTGTLYTVRRELHSL